MITEDYVSFETAKLLKEKGFDEPVRMYFKVNNYPSDTTIQNIKKATGKDMEQIEVNSLFNTEDEPFFNSVEGKDENLFAYPTLQMTMKWLRDIHNFDIIAYPQFDDSKWTYFAIIFKLSFPYTQIKLNDNKDKKEDAYEDAIKYCLKNWI